MVTKTYVCRSYRGKTGRGGGLFFGWALNTALGNTVNSHLKHIFPVTLKDFCVFILIMHILFCRTNQKNVLQKEIDWALLIDWEPCPWFPLTELLKMICARSYAWFLNFFVKRGGLGLFFCGLMSSPNSVKYLWPVQISKNKWAGSISTYPK